MPTIVEGLEYLMDLEEGDLTAIMQALEPMGYTSRSKAGPAFRLFNPYTIVPPLTIRQANLLKAIQRPENLPPSSNFLSTSTNETAHEELA